MQKRIYISGKITGLDPRVAAELFQLAENVIRTRGDYPVNPMKVMPVPVGARWDDHLLTDMVMLMGNKADGGCDGIYMLPNWQESRNSVIIHGIAHERNFPIEYHTETVAEWHSS